MVTNHEQKQTDDARQCPPIVTPMVLVMEEDSRQQDDAWNREAIEQSDRCDGCVLIGLDQKEIRLDVCFEDFRRMFEYVEVCAFCI